MRGREGKEENNQGNERKQATIIKRTQEINHCRNEKINVHGRTESNENKGH